MVQRFERRFSGKECGNAAAGVCVVVCNAAPMGVLLPDPGEAWTFGVNIGPDGRVQ